MKKLVLMIALILMAFTSTFAQQGDHSDQGRHNGNGYGHSDQGRHNGNGYGHRSYRSRHHHRSYYRHDDHRM